MAAQRLHAGLELKVRWTLGHEGIAGNERADVEARRGQQRDECHESSC